MSVIIDDFEVAPGPTPDETAPAATPMEPPVSMTPMEIMDIIRRQAERLARVQAD